MEERKTIDNIKINEYILKDDNMRFIILEKIIKKINELSDAINNIGYEIDNIPFLLNNCSKNIEENNTEENNKDNIIELLANNENFDVSGDNVNYDKVVKNKKTKKERMDIKKMLKKRKKTIMKKDLTLK